MFMDGKGILTAHGMAEGSYAKLMECFWTLDLSVNGGFEARVCP